MNNQKYIIFSFYYINSSNEIDKILKKKYKLNNPGIITHNELYSEILSYKKQYTSNVSLHEILLYENNTQREGDLYRESCLLKDINHAYDISFEPNKCFNNLTRIYIFYKKKSSVSKTRKNKIIK